MNKEWMTIGTSGLALGHHTRVEVTSLSSKRIGNSARRLRLTATLTVTADVNAVPGQCSLCGCETPKLDENAIWYIIKNHDGQGVCSASPESVVDSPDRDCYPVTGWKTFDGELACGPCMTRINNVIDKLKRSMASPVQEDTGA